MHAGLYHFVERALCHDYMKKDKFCKCRKTELDYFFNDETLKMHFLFVSFSAPFSYPVNCSDFRALTLLLLTAIIFLELCN